MGRGAHGVAVQDVGAAVTFSCFDGVFDVPSLALRLLDAIVPLTTVPRGRRPEQRVPWRLSK